MKVEDQVCSLKLAKKLKELGVKQESLFYWGKWFLGDKDKRKYKVAFADCYDVTDHPGHSLEYSAFTVAELGERLPEYCHSWKDNRDNYVCSLEEKQLGFTAKTEANARAKMLIYLKEKKLI